jgi:hypothetical protein
MYVKLAQWYSDYHITSYHENFRKLMMILHAESRAAIVAVTVPRGPFVMCVSNGNCDFSQRSVEYPGEIHEEPSKYWDRMPAWAGWLVNTGNTGAVGNVGNVGNLLSMSHKTHTIWFYRVSAEFKGHVNQTNQTMLHMCADMLVYADALRVADAKVTDVVDQIATAVKPIGSILVTLQSERSKALSITRMYAENMIRLVDHHRILVSSIRFKFDLHEIAELFNAQYYVPEQVLNMTRVIYTDRVRLRELISSVCQAKSWIIVDMVAVNPADESSQCYPDFEQQAYQITFNVTNATMPTDVMEKLAWLMDGQMSRVGSDVRVSLIVYAAPPTRYSTSSLRLIKNKTVVVVGDHRELIQRTLTQIQLVVSVAASIELALDEFPNTFDCAICATSYPRSRVTILVDSLPRANDDIEYKTALVRAVIAALTAD